MANPAADYPTALHTAVDIPALANQSLGGTTPTHTQVHGKIESEIVAIQTKLGIGSDTPVVGEALVGGASGSSSWRALTSSDITDFSNAADGRISAQKAQANGLASLGADSKIPTSQLPVLALTDVNVVASQAAQLLLTAEEGDVAVRTDQNKSYIHNGGTAGTMADWSELLTPTDTVLSVFGRTGVVAAQSGDYTASQITNVAAGNIAGTTVQAALNELDGEKVAGPGSATDNAVVRFDATTGKLVQNSGVLINDSNDLSTLGRVGIGTHTPDFALEVVTSNGSGGVFGIQNTHLAGYSAYDVMDSTGAVRLGVGYGNASAASPYAGSAYIASTGTVPLIFITNNAERLRVDSNGNLTIGVSQDTNLYRRAANELKTDDKFIAAAGIGVGNTASATSLGSVTRRMEIFDASGNSLGFLPIYNSIT